MLNMISGKKIDSNHCRNIGSSGSSSYVNVFIKPSVNMDDYIIDPDNSNNNNNSNKNNLSSSRTINSARVPGENEDGTQNKAINSKSDPNRLSWNPEKAISYHRENFGRKNNKKIITSSSTRRISSGSRNSNDNRQPLTEIYSENTNENKNKNNVNDYHNEMKQHHSQLVAHSKSPSERTSRAANWLKAEHEKVRNAIRLLLLLLLLLLSSLS